VLGRVFVVGKPIFRWRRGYKLTAFEDIGAVTQGM
jgi:hypothetical protein